MNPRRLAVLAVLAPLVACAVAASTPPLEGFRWLTGQWCGKSGSEDIEEQWTSPRGGLMLGMSRSVQGERVTSFEYLRIAIVDGVPTLLAQVQGKPPVPFKWTTGGADWARFENLAHDFPTRVEYRRDGDKLSAQIAGPAEGGRERVIPFEYRQCRG